MEQRLKKYPGIILNFSQPISDNVSEAVAGFKAANGVKIYGDDLEKLENLSQQVISAVASMCRAFATWV